MANDSTLANMLYGNQVSTQKNLVAARGIRHSLRDSVGTDDGGQNLSLPGLVGNT